MSKLSKTQISLYQLYLERRSWTLMIIAIQLFFVLFKDNVTKKYLGIFVLKKWVTPSC